MRANGQRQRAREQQREAGQTGSNHHGSSDGSGSDERGAQTRSRAQQRPHNLTPGPPRPPGTQLPFGLPSRSLTGLASGPVDLPLKVGCAGGPSLGVHTLATRGGHILGSECAAL
ncbi:hypothetical protein D187_005352 [Cystobacter fuscus DSM 2262]|uniref:Uncharacterized protein n=1 Tax=Cystobacter fuscus (strain ATCC 25194 / DSM 2262 / NBRC 100088 / M29) TaxID=1242864 RepID=S9R5I1_CYSF2|nr:hypothetical protein D187_005352 [Cystobacter fuscus DSM 2262]